MISVPIFSLQDNIDKICSIFVVIKRVNIEKIKSRRGRPEGSKTHLELFVVKVEKKWIETIARNRNDRNAQQKSQNQ